MNILSGEIGKLSLNGEQVGGFKYWTAVINKKNPSTHVIASQYWMFKKVDTDKLEAEFYTETRDKPKLIYKREVTVKIPDCELDKMITSPIEMDLGSFSWL